MDVGVRVRVRVSVGVGMCTTCIGDLLERDGVAFAAAAQDVPDNVLGFSLLFLGSEFALSRLWPTMASAAVNTQGRETCAW